MKTPLVSVIFSVYNGAPYLKEAVASVLNQTFDNFEFIIVDDGSTDATAQILDTFTDNRIIRLRNEKNLGLVQSLNNALALAQGEFIARMDADDISHPDRFQKQLFYLEQHPEIGVLGSAMIQVDEHGQPISTLMPPLKHEAVLWHTLFGCAIFHATVMMRRKELADVGGYDINFLHSEDLDLWSRLFGKTKFANLPEVLYTRRLHRKSVISTQFASQYRNGIVIRQRLLKSIFGYDVPIETVTWLIDHNYPLNKNQRAMVIDLLLDIYDKIIGINSNSVDTAKIIHPDLTNQIALVNSSWLKILLRRIIATLGKMLPSPWRHKLKIFIYNLWQKPLVQK